MQIPYLGQEVFWLNLPHKPVVMRKENYACCPELPEGQVGCVRNKSIYPDVFPMKHLLRAV